MSASVYIAALRAKVGKERLHVPAVSVVIRDGGGRVLMVRAWEDSKWTIPGGMIEPDELPSDAAVRETKEETGLDVEIIGVIGIFGGPLYVNTYANGDVASWVETTFEARVIGGSIESEPGETLEVKYVSEKDAHTLDIKPYMAEMIQVIFRGVADPYYSASSTPTSTG